jgi:hypothetical protein
MTSSWDGRSLVSEGTREGPSGVSRRLREVFTPGADGSTLTVDVTSGDGAAGSYVYTRTQDVGPCRSWPTPCKPPARARPY